MVILRPRPASAALRRSPARITILEVLPQSSIDLSEVKKMRIYTIGRWLPVTALALLCGCGHSNSATNSSSNSPNNSAQSTPASAPASSASQASASAQAPAPAPIRIAPGRVLTVSLDQTISTKDNSSGDRFQASLAEPITVDAKPFCASARASPARLSRLPRRAASKEARFSSSRWTASPSTAGNIRLQRWNLKTSPKAAASVR